MFGLDISGSELLHAFVTMLSYFTIGGMTTASYTWVCSVTNRIEEDFFVFFSFVMWPVAIPVMLGWVIGEWIVETTINSFYSIGKSCSSIACSIKRLFGWEKNHAVD